MCLNGRFIIPTLWAKKLIKLDDIKIFNLKKGIGIEWSANHQIVQTSEDQKVCRHRRKFFLSHAHYKDPYFDFIHLLTKLTSN